MNKGRVITIQGNESEWYQKAVFVIKEDIVNVPIQKNIRAEAEKIIGNYAKKNGFSSPKPASKLDTTLNLILWGCICVLTIGLCLL